MKDDTTSQDAVENRYEETSRRQFSRRSMLASVGAGVAGLALGGVAEPAVASGESRPPAEYADASSPTTTATSDGSWSDGATWDNGVPAAGQAVRIDPGVTITVDGTTEDIKTLDVAGTLTFATDTDSDLRVETIVTRPDSTTHIGTESSPIQQGSEARITFVHHEDISEKDNDPERVSKGLLTMGELEIHGAEKTSWDGLASAPTAGDTTIELSSAPTNWTEGDELVIPGLDPHTNEDEERTIASVSGSTVELDAALEHDHVPPENNLDVELRAYALNLTRNVVLESEVQETDPDREKRINRQGHMMVMQPAQSLHNFRTIHLGRTNKKFKIDNPRHGSETSDGDEPNPQARYAVHTHMTGLDAEPHDFSGVVAQNSPGWGIVNHHSHANVRDSITYQVYGAGFVGESGPERGTFERCFALRSRGSPNNRRLADRETHPEFGHEGNGFWFQGPGIAMEDCVAAGHDSYAYGIWGEPLYNHPKFDGEVSFSTDGGAATLDNEVGNYPDELAIEDGLLPSDADTGGATKSSYLTLKSFTNNTVFASGGGLDFADFNFRGRATDEESVVETFTVYNIRSFGGYGDFGGNRAGEGGKCAVAQRYANHLFVKNPQFCNNGVGGGHGIRRNFYPESGHEEGGVIEGFDVGIETIDSGTEPIRDVTFVDNNVDIDQKPLHDNGPLSIHLENIDFGDSGTGFDLSFSWGHTATSKLFSDSTRFTLDGEPVYFEQQAPEYVPFEDGDIGKLKFTGQLPGVLGVSSKEEAKAAVAGKTNEELQAEFGTSIYGELIPSEAESHPDFDGGMVGGSNEHPSGEITVEPKASMTGESVTAEATGLTDADGTIDRVDWTFGNGESETGETVTTSYADTGDYEVTAHVVDDDGGTTVFSRTVSVVDELNPAADPGPVSNGIRYELSGSSSGNSVHDGQITLDPIPGGAWKDGIDYDGYLLVPEDGVYSLTLTADKEATVYIDDEAILEANEGTDSTGIGLRAGLHEFRVDYWEQFGHAELSVALDGPGMSGEIPADALYHTDEDGEIVGEMPQATFSTTSNSETTASFDASGSSTPADSITSYEWEFGDGASGSGETVEHSFDKPGHYDVTLTVTDDAGHSDDITKEVEVGETHHILIDGRSEQETGYELSVGGTLNKGEYATEQDSVEGSTVSGRIGGHQDSYHYGGEITSWSLDEEVPLRIVIDGEEVDQSTLGDGASESESVTEAIDADDDGDIDDIEILNALDYWQNDEEVPGTGGQTVDEQTLLELVDSWAGKDSE